MADHHEELDEAPEPVTTLDPETAARRRAALRHVRKFGDPVLRSKARAVDRFDAELRDEIGKMGVLMDDAYGIGLAATQVGILHRVLVYRVEPDSPVNALVNPEIEWTSKDKEWAEEGCLSLPAVHVDVERPVHIRVRAQDESGEQILVEMAHRPLARRRRRVIVGRRHLAVDELRLTAFAPRGHHAVAGHRVGDLRAVVTPNDVQTQVDSRGEPR